MTDPTVAVTAAEARVLAELRDLEPYLVDLTSRLVQVVSTSPNMLEPKARTPGEAAANRVVAQAMTELGLKVDEVEVASDRLNVVGTLAGSGGGRSLGFNGHIDTVPATVEQGWARDPWSGAIEAGRVWGRGATDQKGGVAAMVVAAGAIARSGVRLAGDIVLQSVCGEELADPEGTQAVIDAGYVTDACINTEPSLDLGTADLAIHPVSNGVILLRVTLRGKATHSALRQEWLYPGGRPNIGVNALEKGVDLVRAVQELEHAWAFTKRHPLFPAGKFTLHPGYFFSGPPDGSGPYFPTETCVIEWIIFYHPDETPEQAKAEVEQYILGWAGRDPWLAEHPPEIEWFAELANFDVRVDHPLIRTVEEAYESVTGRRPPVTALLAGSDATQLNAHGIPTVVHGPGELSLAHMTNEYVEIENLHRAARTYALAAIRWCGVADQGGEQ